MRDDKNNADTQDQDKDLRGRFAALRSEEAAHSPQFALPESGKIHPQLWRWGYIRLTTAACVVAMAVVIGLRLVPRKPQRNTTSVASLTEWKAPTDFLLETPGRELLQTVPVIGAWPDSSTISDPGRKRQQGKQVNSQARKRALP
jgi:hypothetical protein